jgi:hypothetical protein
MNRPEQLEKVQKEGYNLFVKKNKDYGDSFATYGPIGVIVRMGDKISRLTSLTKSGIQLVDNESVRDTLIDLHNYAAMAVMLMDEKDQKAHMADEIRRISLLTAHPKKDVIVDGGDNWKDTQENSDLPYSVRWPDTSNNNHQPSWPPSVNNR